MVERGPRFPRPRGILAPFSAGFFSAVMSLAPANFDLKPPVDCPSSVDSPNALTLQLDREKNPLLNCDLVVRAPTQKIIAAGYGHREKDEIMREGNIADGFRPVDGVEYAEADLEMAFDMLEKMKYARVDAIAFSWHSVDDGKPDHKDKDWRDKFLQWWTFTVMNHPDNPYKEAQFSIIAEIDSNEQTVPKRDVRKIYEHLRPILEHRNFWRNDEGDAKIMIYLEENEILSRNSKVFKNWGDPGERYGVEPIFQDFIGSNWINPGNRYKTFYYGNPIWDIRPSGINITPGMARVTIAYWKKDDLKVIEFDPGEFQANLQKAINSGKDVIIVSWNEYFEHSQAREKARQVMHDTIPTLPNFFKPVGGEQYIKIVQDSIDNQPHPLPRSETPSSNSREIILFAMENEARKRKEDEDSLPKAA